MLQPLDTTPRYKEIQEQLTQYIIKRNLQPGDRLPSENGIASQLGVSRNAVREALKSLAALGIIEVRMGLGTYVKEFSLADLLDYLPYELFFDARTPKELYEIRKRLELSFIKTAVSNVTDEDIAEMRVILREMQKKTEQGLPFPDEDMALHRLIFRSVENHSLLKLLDIFGVLYKNVLYTSSISENDIQQDLQNHIELVEAIAARNEEEAWNCLDKQFQDWNAARLLEQPE